MFISLNNVVNGLMFIISVQVPDMEGDVLGGKNTVATRRGRPFAFAMTAVLTGVAFGYLTLMSVIAGKVLDVSLPVVAGLSAIPLVFTLAALARMPVAREAATPATSMSVGSLFLFVGLVDAYLLVAVW